MNFGDLIRAARAATTLMWAARSSFAALVASRSLLVVRRAAAAPSVARHRARLSFVLALANPSLTREDRDPLTSVAVVVVDKSPSQNFGDRTQQTEEVRAALAAAARPHARPRSALRRSRPGRRRDRRHAAVLGASARRSPTCRTTASPARSSSPTARVHDVPAEAAALGFAAPVHALITGQPDERDRRVVL